MLKTPKSKDVIGNVVTGLSLAGGAMLSDGAVALVPAEHKTVGKAAIAGVSLVGAAAIKGTSQAVKTVQLVLVGMGVMQVVGLVRENLADSVKQSGTGTGAKLINGAMGLQGLNCGCGGSGLGYSEYPALMYPTIQHIDWDREFVPSRQGEYIDFEEVPNNMF